LLKNPDKGGYIMNRESRVSIIVSITLAALILISCSSTPLILSRDPEDRLKGIPNEYDEIKHVGDKIASGQIVRMRSGTEHSQVAEFEYKVKNLGKISRNDPDERVRLSASQQLDRLATDANYVLRREAMPQVNNKQIITQAALTDDDHVVRCIATARLSDQALLGDIAKRPNLYGRVARIRLGLMDPVVARNMGQEPVLTCEGRQAGVIDTDRAKKQSTLRRYRSSVIVEIRLADKELSRKSEVLQDLSFEKDGTPKPHVSANPKVEIQPTDMLYDVLSKMAFPNSAATEIFQTTKSVDLKEAADKYLEKQQDKKSK
jgi:hypothetical protein